MKPIERENKTKENNILLSIRKEQNKTTSIGTKNNRRKGIENIVGYLFVIILSTIFLYRIIQIFTILKNYPWKANFKEEEKILREKENIEKLLLWNDRFHKEIINEIYPANLVAAVCFSAVPGLQIEQFHMELLNTSHRIRCTVKVHSEEPNSMEALGFYCALVSLAFEKSVGKKIKFEFSNIQLPKEKKEQIRATLTCFLSKEELR
ncbi:hypothetical protein A7K73_10830 [Candidatus Methylacidiphilum fumarolicum]|nr:hypothetical protein [Candidatus Methylacidiphilum fumarolicum]MBW6415995.1 hypothetical protein [Candidatus Methylacidiphilum fumarolicum]TFE66040.1 hypothetical protein A7K73_10830 [Candidatus Methylacidiphilum fumarolicum]TFE73033.1 hypothetical protein A7K72_07425 [Candidatus Methylacidiphilum fumarolicum]